ncbi:MAG: hypothetical protein IPI65_16915 [Bacteroidetes bacterium]|nr:hypothetical protein [Bacteroidota bacterium]
MTIFRITFVIIIICGKNIAQAQVPTILYQNTIGGGLNDYTQHLISCDDYGFLICGYSNSAAGYDKTLGCYEESDDFWIVRVDSNLNVLWNKTIGGNQLDHITCGVKVPSGFLIGGYSNSVISGDKEEAPVIDPYYIDFWVMLLNEDGEILWQNTIGGSEGDMLFDICPDNDSGYLLTGYSTSNSSGDKVEPNLGDPSTSDYWIVKIDSIGNVVWQNTIGGDFSDIPGGAILNNDGSFFIAGISNSPISDDKVDSHYGALLYYDLWLVKLDSFGNVLWTKTIGTVEDDKFGDIEATCDGGFILVSSTQGGISYDKTTPSFGGSDYWVLKFDTEGDLLWQNSFGGNQSDIPRSISQNIDGIFNRWNFLLRNFWNKK